MRNPIIIALILVVAFTLGVTTTALAGGHDHSRTGFFIGFGLGWGNAGSEINGFDTDRENSASGNFRLGWAPSESVTLGLESTSWVKNYDIEGTTADLSLTGTVTAFAATYFPGNVGFYMRGGLGLATAKAEITDNGFSASGSDNGLGILAATGYEWRLTEKFALGPQVQYAHLSLNGDGADNMDFVSVTAQMNWYW